jgi:isocitrate/isopropylmalate dehydrogenase
MILSAKMMLEYLKMEKEAQSLEKAVAQVYREKHLTADQGGKATPRIRRGSAEENLKTYRRDRGERRG